MLFRAKLSEFLHKRKKYFEKLKQIGDIPIKGLTPQSNNPCVYDVIRVLFKISQKNISRPINYER